MTESSIDQQKVSVYMLYTPFQRRMILLACGFIALLTPFTDTIYFPALTSVESTLNTNTTKVGLSVSLYLLFVGVGQVIWGPLADTYGRQLFLYGSLLLFLLFSLGCIFVTSIDQLIILRSLQGFFVGCTLLIAQAVVSDSFPTDERGEAMGAFLVSIFNKFSVTII